MRIGVRYLTSGKKKQQSAAGTQQRCVSTARMNNDAIYALGFDADPRVVHGKGLIPRKWIAVHRKPPGGGEVFDLFQHPSGGRIGF